MWQQNVANFQGRNRNAVYMGQGTSILPDPPRCVSPLPQAQYSARQTTQYDGQANAWTHQTSHMAPNINESSRQSQHIQNREAAQSDFGLAPRDRPRSKTEGGFFRETWQQPGGYAANYDQQQSNGRSGATKPEGNREMWPPPPVTVPSRKTIAFLPGDGNTSQQTQSIAYGASYGQGSEQRTPQSLALQDSSRPYGTAPQQGNREMWPPPPITTSQSKTAVIASDESNRRLPSQGNQEMWPPPPLSAGSRKTVGFRANDENSTQGNQEMWPPPPLSVASRKTVGYLADDQSSMQSNGEMRPPPLSTTSRKSVAVLAEGEPKLAVESSHQQRLSISSIGASSTLSTSSHLDQAMKLPSRKTVVVSSNSDFSDVVSSRPRSKTEGCYQDTSSPLDLYGQSPENLPHRSTKVEKRKTICFLPDDVVDEVDPVNSLEGGGKPEVTVENLLSELRGYQRENGELRGALDIAEKAFAKTSDAYRKIRSSEEEQALQEREMEATCREQVEALERKLEAAVESKHSESCYPRKPSTDQTREDLYGTLMSELAVEKERVRTLEADISMAQVWGSANTTLEEELEETKDIVTDLRHRLDNPAEHEKSSGCVYEKAEERIASLQIADEEAQAIAAKETDGLHARNILVSQELQDALHQLERARVKRSETDDALANESFQCEVLLSSLEMSQEQVQELRKESQISKESQNGFKKLDTQDIGVQNDLMKPDTREIGIQTVDQFLMSTGNIDKESPTSLMVDHFVMSTGNIDEHAPTSLTAEQFVMSTGNVDEVAPTSLSMSSSAVDTFKTVDTMGGYLLSVGVGSPTPRNRDLLEEAPISEFWDMPDAPGAEALEELSLSQKQLYQSLEVRFRTGRRHALPQKMLPPPLELLRRSYMLDPDYMRKIVAELFAKHDTYKHGYLSWRSGEATGFLTDFFALHDFPAPRLPTVVFSSIFNQVKMESGRDDVKGLNIEEMCQFATRVYDFIYKDLRGEMKFLQSTKGSVNDEDENETPRRPALRSAKKHFTMHV